MSHELLFKLNIPYSEMGSRIEKAPPAAPGSESGTEVKEVVGLMMAGLFAAAHYGLFWGLGLLAVGGALLGWSLLPKANSRGWLERAA